MTSVKVAVRVRPINQREYDLDSKFIIQMDGKKTTITNLKIPETVHEGDTGRDLMRNKEFTFDYSFWSVLKTDPMYVSQEQVYRALGFDVVDSAFEGYNACVFAYGQTGSGKSYTMMGGHEDQGLIPRICKDLFSRMSDDDTNYRTEVSYLEIYNEKVRDLLKQHSPNKSMHSLRVREHPKYGPYVQDLSKHIVNDFEDIYDLMNQGNAVRTTASTNMNDVSSRSHAIFTIVFTQAKFSDDMPCETSSKIHLVDLAGSERADASGATGQRLKEGASINKSLVTLGTVIKVLAEMSSNKYAKNLFIPYRDSVLTWLLKDSLGGNSRTIMIATISPADVNYGETLSTLRYANRAKNIINRPTVNEDPNVKIIRELREEISRLKALLGGNIDNISTPKVQEKLHENEARVKVLTEEWAGKWNETANILKDKNLALRKEGLGVVLDSTLPHLIGIDDDILSTGIMLYHLKEGVTTVGRGDAQVPPDIVIAGIDVEENHCIINHINGEVNLEPLDGAYCVINGTVAVESTKLTQGAVILLGKTNMFRFNHPAEAAKMKQELQNCGLSLSRTSLLSKSMSDLYRSTENLSLMGIGFELDGYSKDLEKMEEKRREIDILEKKYVKSERERDSTQTSLEKELEDKQYQLELLNIDIQKFKKQIEEIKKNVNSVKSFEELLQELNDREVYIKNAAEDEIRKLEEEIICVKEEGEKRKKICQVDLSELSDREIMLKGQLKKSEDEISEMITKRNEMLKEGEERLLHEVEELQESIRQFDEKKQKILEANEDVRSKFLEEEEKKIQLVDIFEREEIENKEKWKPHLEKIAQENKSLEEAWNDLQEHEEELNLLMENIDELSDEQRKQLLTEQKELKQARTLLKCEEQKISEKEKSLLDRIEKDLDECEKRKEKSLNEIRNRQDKILFEVDSKLLDMNKDIKNKESGLKLIEDNNSSNSQDMLTLKNRLKEVNDKHIKQNEELVEKKNCVVRESEESTKQQEQMLVDFQNKIEDVKNNLQTELAKILEEKQQLLGRKSDFEGKTDHEETHTNIEMAKKQKKIEELKAVVERKEQELEDKWKEFDEQRDAELYKLESERLKLQDMEHQERINALVEQEVKRRLFEEKVQRENWRKQEREKERKERDTEIQKLKEQHSRELKLLKARYEKEQQTNAAKVVNPTRANPYATVHSPDADMESSELPRRKSTSSSSLSSGMIFSSDTHVLSISIPSYRLHGYGSDTHYEYEVKVIVSDDCWTIFRRYSKFRQLHQEHRRRYPEVNALVFPPKKLFSRSEKVVVERRRQLELYLRNLLAIFLNSPLCPLHPSQCKYLSKKVLCDFELFFRKGLFEVTKHGTT